jgi:hypothetical protein
MSIKQILVNLVFRKHKIQFYSAVSDHLKKVKVAVSVDLNCDVSGHINETCVLYTQVSFKISPVMSQFK